MCSWKMAASCPGRSGPRPSRLYPAALPRTSGSPAAGAWSRICEIRAHPLCAVPGPTCRSAGVFIPPKCGLTVNVSVTCFCQEWFTCHAFVACAWDSIFCLFLEFLSQSLLEQDSTAPVTRVCCEARFGSSEVSLLTTGPILNRSLTLCFHMYEMRIGAGASL